jgi:hypothetical protein
MGIPGAALVISLAYDGRVCALASLLRGHEEGKEGWKYPERHPLISLFAMEWSERCLFWRRMMGTKEHRLVISFWHLECMSQG